MPSDAPAEAASSAPAGSIAGVLGDGMLGLLSGAAVAALPGKANVVAVIAGALCGAAVGALSFRVSGVPRRFRWPELLLLAFFVPAASLAVAPGADMAMHVALARGLLHGTLSPAWPGTASALYPRGFSALVALLSPLGLARAGLVAAGLSYVVFYRGLAALVPWPAALVAVFLSRTPQAFFDWGGNPTALALGLGFAGAGAVREGRGLFAALLFAGSAATHPMAACAAALPAAFEGVRGRRPFICAFALLGAGVTVGVLAAFGPSLSPRELGWIRDYAARHEAVPLRSTFAVVGDPAAILSALAALCLLLRRRFGPVILAASGIVGCAALFALLPRIGLYPIRFAPLLLLCLAPLWATLPRPVLWLALLAAVPLHLRLYQRAVPLANARDLEAIACAGREARPGEVIDGAYGDATQWIPALTGHPVTHPHIHVSLFDEAEARLSRLPPPRLRFTGERLRYGAALPPLPPQAQARCGGALWILAP